MGQKILVPCFDVYNDRPFPEKYTVKDYIFNTKLEKGDHYYIQTRHKDFFSYYNLILRRRYFFICSTYTTNKCLFIISNNFKQKIKP